MATYSINEMARITGVKAHTIRAWEKRYGIFSPNRCMMNIRSYEEKDLDLLKCIVKLRVNGKKIGDIADMTDEEIDQELVFCCQGESACADHYEIINKQIINLDAEGFENWIDSKISSLGVEQAIITEIFPLQNKLRLLQMTGQMPQLNCEVVNQVVLRKLASNIQKAKHQNPYKKTALLFIPQSDTSNICSLFLHYLLVARGYKTLNLGGLSNISEIKNAIKLSGPFDAVVVLLIEKFNKASAGDYISKLVDYCPDSKFYVSGYQIKTIKDLNRKNLTVFNKISDMVHIS